MAGIEVGKIVWAISCIFTRKMSTSEKISIDKISIRTDVKPGDFGLITWMHGKYYFEENGYDLGFECYVAEGLAEFYRNYNASRSRMWMCEHNRKFIGSMALMDRGDTAQLRYFFILKEYRGCGLGKKLMNLFSEFLHECAYTKAYLWTVKGLPEAAALYTRYGFVPDEEKVSKAFGFQLTEQKFVWSKR